MSKLPTLPVTKYSDAALVVVQLIQRTIEPRVVAREEVVKLILDPKFVLDPLIVAPLFQTNVLSAVERSYVVDAAFFAARAELLRREAAQMQRWAGKAAAHLETYFKACFGERVTEFNLLSAAAHASVVRAQKRAARLGRGGGA